ncbi:unnamed protein product, partial [Ectocarpus sp. 12 AP-2014]
AEITNAANTHQCTYTCHKHGHANSCRFGFGKDGKPLESRTCVQRGFRQIYPNGDSIVGGVLYSASQSGDAIAAADAAAAKEE